MKKVNRTTRNDALGDRMKAYESHESARRFLPLLPIYARLDGRGFSAFTRGMERPFDIRMTEAMVETTKGLIKKTHARIGYTQSDEISLVWLAETYDSSIFFDGKVLKVASVLAGLTTALFGRAIRCLGPEYEDRLPHFDCRVLQFPNKTEAANMFLWRELNANKNAIRMAARSVYSHKALDRKTSADMRNMLLAKGINFNDYQAFFKRGTYVRRTTKERPFSAEELARIPERHRPRSDALVTRSAIVALDMPPFASLTNRMEVLFDSADPTLAIELSDA